MFSQIIPVCPHICEFLCEYHQTWGHCLCPKSGEVTHPQEAIFFSQDEIPRGAFQASHRLRDSVSVGHLHFCRDSSTNYCVYLTQVCEQEGV